MSSFNPFGSAVTTSVSVVAGLLAQVKASKAIMLRDDIPGGNAKLLKAGDGMEAIDIKLSVGNGKGSSRLDLLGSQLPSVNELLADFDLDFDPAALSPSECVARTLQRETQKEGEDLITFKVSLAKNSRSIKVPVSEWAAFVEFMGNVEKWTHGAVESFRTHIANLEEEVNAGE